MTVWRTAFAIIGDYPILGIGVGAFPMANQQYARDLAHDGSVFGRAGAPRQDAHSTYLTVWTELGTVGLLAYCGLLGATWHRVRTVRRRWGAFAPQECAALGVLQAGLGGYLVACVWASYTVLTLPYLFFALIFAWATAVDAWCRAQYRPAMPSPVRRAVAP
jgi:O-antigen ligase